MKKLDIGEKLIREAELETEDNKRRMFSNITTKNIDELEPYSNKHFLDLISFVMRSSKK